MDVAAPAPGGMCAASMWKPGQQVADERARVAEAGLAEELGGAETEQLAHAGGQGAQREGLGGELARGRRVDRRRARRARVPSASETTAESQRPAPPAVSEPTPETDAPGTADVTDAAKVRSERAMPSG